MSLETTKVIKKRKYSRAGCLQCKKRKVKCDESKPGCLNCQKSGKACSFMDNVRDDDDSIPPTNAPTNGTSGGISLNNGISELESFTNYGLKSVGKTPTQDSRADLFSLTDKLSYNNQTVFQSETTLGIEKPKIAPSYALGNYTSDQLFSNASVLAHDLNDLLEMHLEGVPQDGLEAHVPLAQEPVSSSGPTTNSIGDDLFDDESIRNWILAFDMVQGHKNYLRLFYEKYSLWLMPLSPESGPKNFFNKAIIHQAQRFPFLLNAIFSMTASFEFKVTGNSSDEYYKKYYISLSLKGLNAVFDELDRTETVMESIEPLILTSLIFVTDTALSINGSWRNHLRGANNLFKQYLTLREAATPIILLATTWFASFEIIAVMTSPGGGSINNEDLLEDILLPILYKNDWNLAIQLGLVLPNGFNVFLGQSSENVYLFIRFLKMSIKIKKSASKMIDSDDLLELSCLLEKAMKFSVASSNGLIEPSSPYFPKTNGMNFLPQETYGYKGDLVFSWFDISDKIHLRSLYLTILTNQMFLNIPKESGIVQDVVKKILQMCYFFQGIDFSQDTLNFNQIIAENPILKDRRLLMLHSSLLNCGLCCIEKIDQLKVQLYFQCLILMGATTVDNSYKRILDYWKGDSKNLDFVPYL